MKQILVGASFLLFCSCGFPDINSELRTAEIIAVDNNKDSVAIKEILKSNNIDTSLIGAVSKISYTSASNRKIFIELNGFGLDTIRIPDGIEFGTPKVVLSARNNHFKSWQKECEKIIGLIDLDFGQDTISSFVTGQGNRTLSDLSLTDCRLRSIDLPIDRFPALSTMNLNGNFLTDLPASYTATRIKIDVRGNSICNPSAALDAFLKLNDQQWRASQICPASP